MEAYRKPQNASRKPPVRFKKFQGRNPEIISLVFLSKQCLIPKGHFEINWPFRYHNWYSTIKLRQIHVRKILSTPRGLFLTITNLGVLYEINKSQIFPSIFAKLKFRSFFNETTSCIALMKVYQYYLIRDQWQVPGAHVHILSIGSIHW